MDESETIPYPQVSISIRLKPDSAWFTAYISVLEYHSFLATGASNGIEAFEIKVVEWNSENNEFHDCYIIFNPTTKSWRIGHDT
jgi:hypothetical protein